MGGKSTFLRQNALIVLLAQAGGFVPAEAATIGMVDRLFSRVGASDNLARGRSTFMVEMVETAAILAQASERSFVILDEVGAAPRPTMASRSPGRWWRRSTRSTAPCLFATHYHELARLAESCDALSLHHVRARMERRLVLLHELAEGPADKSYGLAVARLAGVLAPVVKRAKAVLDKLEKAAPPPGASPPGWATCRCSPPRSRRWRKRSMPCAPGSTGWTSTRCPARGAGPALRTEGTGEWLSLPRSAPGACCS
jgi:DNA mismatch repair protein MutS